MYHCAETFLPSLLPFAPIVTQWFYRAACFWKTRLRRSVSKETCLRGSQESLASGFHLKHKGVFLPDLYSFTQWVDLPLLFPSKESPDETFVRPIIGYVRVASSSASLGAQPQALSWMDFFFPGLFPLLCFFVYILRNISDKCFSSVFFSFCACVISVIPKLVTLKFPCQNPEPTN